MLNRLSGLLNGSMLPNLHVSERVLDRIRAAAKHHLADETGEAMFGMMIVDQASERVNLYILDTIPPGSDSVVAPEERAVREAFTFQQGDDWQDDVLHWMRANWQLVRQRRTESYGSATARWDSSLYHLGDWHKQPGDMIAPSGGDLQTALMWIHDIGNRLGFLVAPILTLDYPADTPEPTEGDNYLLLDQADGRKSRLDFWYIDRGRFSFAPIAPKVLPDRTFPHLADYAWHLTSPVRVDQEETLLRGEGVFFSRLYWDTDEALPMEVCYLIARPAARHYLLIATPANYPYSEPDVYRMPFSAILPDEDIPELMGRIWTYAELVEMPSDWVWSSGKTILETLYAAEDALEAVGGV
ncbi:MAG: hypothetical protein ACOYL5_02935 [Phototrophicaceae bacterium]|jgi:hypothetical protein